MNAEDMTPDELRLLAARKEAAEVPVPVDDPDWSDILSMADGIVKCVVEESYHYDNDDAQYMLEG